MSAWIDGQDYHRHYALGHGTGSVDRIFSLDMIFFRVLVF